MPRHAVPSLRNEKVGLGREEGQGEERRGQRGDALSAIRTPGKGTDRYWKTRRGGGGAFSFSKGGAHSFAASLTLSLSLSPTRTWERGWWRQQLAMEGEGGRHEIRPSTGRRDTRDVNTTRLRRRGGGMREEERRERSRLRSGEIRCISSIDHYYWTIFPV